MRNKLPSSFCNIKSKLLSLMSWHIPHLLLHFSIPASSLWAREEVAPFLCSYFAPFLDHPTIHPFTCLSLIQLQSLAQVAFFPRLPQCALSVLCSVETCLYFTPLNTWLHAVWWCWLWIHEVCRTLVSCVRWGLLFFLCGLCSLEYCWADNLWSEKAFWLIKIIKI